MPDHDFRSAVLAELGFKAEDGAPYHIGPAQQIKALYETLNDRDVNLGKVDLSTMTNKQINCLMSVNGGFRNYQCMCFLNEDMELIVTTQYRYQEEHQSTRYRVDWMTMMIDFVMGKQEDRKEEPR